MSLKRISPQEAAELMQSEGYVYVDVRSIPEFDAGHPEGAYNVPLMHAGPSGMSPNPEFLTIVETTFGKDAKLIIGCKMGGRSMRAAQILLGAGFTAIVDQHAGFDGKRGTFGELEHAGWKPAGLPITAQAEPGRTYEELAKAAGKS